MNAIIKGTNDIVFMLPVQETNLYGCWYIDGNSKTTYDYTQIDFIGDIQSYFD